MFSGAVAIAIHGEDGAGPLSAVSLAHCATQSLGVPRNVPLDATAPPRIPGSLTSP